MEHVVILAAAWLPSVLLAAFMVAHVATDPSLN